MADGVSAVVDNRDIIAALEALGPAAGPFVGAASQITAEAIAREARARLQRQLGPNATGAAVAGITARPAYDENGWIVEAYLPPDQRISQHTSTRSGRTWTQGVTTNNLPLWLEKGTKRGKGTHANEARPYFYVSVELEQGPHARRIAEAIELARESVGLGD